VVQPLIPQRPLEELIHHVLWYGRPSLAWVMRWSEGGADPITAAWNACDVPRDLMAVLQLLAGTLSGHWGRADSRWPATWHVWPNECRLRDLAGETVVCPDCARLIREAVQPAPALEEILGLPERFPEYGALGRREGTGVRFVAC
jgi:hypothetical protein